MSNSKQLLKLVARILENLPPHISKEVMQEWIEDPHSLKKLLYKLNSYEKCLKCLGEVKHGRTLPSWSKRHDLRSLFEMHNVNITFKELILNKARVAHSVPEMLVSYCDTEVRGSSVFEILAEFPEYGIFKSVNSLLPFLYGLIFQNSSSEGSLNTFIRRNGYGKSWGTANRFFVLVGDELIEVILRLENERKNIWGLSASTLEYHFRIPICDRVFLAPPTS